MADDPAIADTLGRVLQIAVRTSPVHATTLFPPTYEIYRLAAQALSENWEALPADVLQRVVPVDVRQSPDLLERYRQILRALVSLWTHLQALARTDPAIVNPYLRAALLLQAPQRTYWKRLLALSNEELQSFQDMLEKMEAEAPAGRPHLESVKQQVRFVRDELRANPFYRLARDLMDGAAPIDDAPAAALRAAQASDWNAAQTDDLDALAQFLKDSHVDTTLAAVVWLVRLQAAMAMPSADFDARVKRAMLLSTAVVALPRGTPFIGPILSLLETIAAQLDQQDDAESRQRGARMHGSIGVAALYQHDYDAAVRALSASLTQAVAQRDRVACVNRSRQLAEALLDADRIREALRYIRWSTRLSRRDHADKQVPRLRLYSQILERSGRYAAATRKAEHAIEMAPACDASDEIAAAAQRYEACAWREARHDEGLRRLEALARQTQGKLTIVEQIRLLGSQGQLASGAGHTDRAMEYLVHALDLCTTTDDPGALVIVVSCLAEVYNRSRDPERTLDFLEPFFDDETLGARILSTAGLTAVEAYVDTGRLSDALDMIARAEPTLSPANRVRANLLRAFIWSNQGRPDLAIPVAEEVVRAAPAYDMRFVTRSHWLLSRLHRRLGDHTKASWHETEALRGARGLGRVEFLELATEVASVHQDDGDPRDAIAKQLLAEIQSSPEPLPRQVQWRAQWLRADVAGDANAMDRIAALREAVRSAPPAPRPRLLLDLSAALFADGNAEWEPTWRRAVEAFRSSPEGSRVIDTIDDPGKERSGFTWKLLDLLLPAGHLHDAANEALLSKSASFRFRVEAQAHVTPAPVHAGLIEERLALLRSARDREMAAELAYEHDPKRAGDAATRARIERLLETRPEPPKRRRAVAATPAVPIDTPRPLDLLTRLSRERPDTLFVEIYSTWSDTMVVHAQAGDVKIEPLPFGSMAMTEIHARGHASTTLSDYVRVANDGLALQLHRLVVDGSVEQVDKVEREIARASDVLTRCFDGVLDARVMDPGTTRVVLMPHAVMAPLPIHTLLRIQERPLIDWVDVGYAPNVFALERMLTFPPPSRDLPAIVVGDADPTIVFTGAEIATFERLLGARRLDGRDASIAEIVEAMREARWVHMVGHGIQDQMLPLDSGVTLRGKRLTVDDFYDRLRLHQGCTVSMNACGAASQFVTPYDYDVGLTSALLLAGAGSVVAPCWPVDDLAAFLFILLLIGSLGSSRDLCAAACASQRAMRDLSKARFLDEWAPRLRALAGTREHEDLARRLEAGLDDYPFRRQIHWMPFVCVGGWRGGIADAD